MARLNEMRRMLSARMRPSRDPITNAHAIHILGVGLTREKGKEAFTSSTSVLDFLILNTRSLGPQADPVAEIQCALADLWYE